MNLADSYVEWGIKFNDAVRKFKKGSPLSNPELFAKLGMSDAAFYRRMEDFRYWNLTEIENMLSLFDDSNFINPDTFYNYLDFVENIKEYIRESGFKTYYVSEKVNLTKNQLYRRYENIDAWKIDEVKAIYELIHKNLE